MGLNLVELIEGNILFNNVLDAFYLCIYDVSRMVKNHSDRKKENLLSPIYGVLYAPSHRQDNTV